MPQPSIVRYETYRGSERSYSLSNATLALGQIFLLSSAIIVISPSQVSPLQQIDTIHYDHIDDTLEIKQTQKEDRALLRVSGAECHIVAEGKEVDNLISKIDHFEENDDISLYVLASKSEAITMETYGKIDRGLDLERLSFWVNDYKQFKYEIKKEIGQSTQGLEGLTDILSLLDITANVIEVIGAAGGVSLWIIKKLLERRNRLNNPFVRSYITQVDNILKFFGNVSKARISEISEGTGIPKDNLLHLLKSLSFEHESVCYWHSPIINNELIKPALSRVKLKKMIKPMISLIVKLVIILFIVGAIFVALKSNLDETVLTYLTLFLLLVILFVIAKDIDFS